MKFVALVSGGKDSVYSVLECTRFGHSLVAVANLYFDAPGEGSNIATQEADSFMFQTVGHNVAVCMGACLGTPMYRIATKGKAVQSGVEYMVPAGTSGATDEVEDLFHLISCVKHDFPDIQGVASGAILSNYQRIRVENVYVL